LYRYIAVMDFACPGLLGDLGKFKRVFSGPVERSRDKHASEEERKVGAARSEQLGGGPAQVQCTQLTLSCLKAPGFNNP
jgi:hypothetical protein